MIQENKRAPTGVSEVDIWLTIVRSPLDVTVEERHKSLLDESELARWQRFTVQGARDQFLTAHAFLRIVLSKYATVAPKRWRYDTNNHGWPYIVLPVACRSIRFSLSHTDGLVAVGIRMSHDIGVDVENTSRNLDALKLVQHSFPPLVSNCINIRY